MNASILATRSLALMLGDRRIWRPVKISNHHST